MRAYGRAGGAQRWFEVGNLPVPSRWLPLGTILVEETWAQSGKVALYARVFSHDQSADRERQLGQLVEWAASHDLAVDLAVAEVGSGMNGARPKLRRLLAESQPSWWSIATGWPGWARST